MTTIGFIGTGAIAEAFINGLMASGKAPTIRVSPRSAAVADRLAARHPNVTKAPSNAAVALGADIVFLAMGPTQVEEALEGVSFRAGQIVCSFVTGLSLQDLADIAPEATICRVLPLPMVAFNKGPLIHLPQVPEIVELLRDMGELILPESEAELVALGGISGFMSTFFELQHALVGSLERKDVQTADARPYVCSMFAALAETSLRSPVSLEKLADEHETRGGLNERTRSGLKKNGWFDEPLAVIEEVARLRRSGLG